MIVAAALAGLEMLTGTFYILLMAIAALAACLGALLDQDLTGQLLIFGVFALVETVVFTVYRRKKTPTQIQSMLDVGNPTVFQEIAPDGLWIVRYRGANWQARPASEKTDPKGALVIASTLGNILIVDNPAPESPNLNP